MDDDDLMSAYKGGDYRAFEQLYLRNSGRVYAFLAKSLPDGAVRDEVFQEVFLRVHKGRGKYIDGFPFRAWLFAITRNTLIDHRRARARLREDATESSILEQRGEVRAPNMDELLEAGDLSERDRNVLQLHYLEGLSFRQIAARLGISPANGRQIASRAIRRLKAVFGVTVADNE